MTTLIYCDRPDCGITELHKHCDECDYIYTLYITEYVACDEWSDNYEKCENVIL
jgi:hypothetical protein